MRRLPLLVAVNKIDRKKPSEAFLEKMRDKAGHVIALTCKDPLKREGYREALQGLLMKLAPGDFFRAPSLIAGLLPAGGLVVLVVPIDPEDPKGRLILPQVQTIRDALDGDAMCLIVKERELLAALNGLKRPPDLVVTDSRAVRKVSDDVPTDIPVTTVCVLMARQKGGLAAQAEGAAAIETLQPGDRVLIAEACSQHAPEDDIGRVKIPRWLRQFVGGRARDRDLFGARGSGKRVGLQTDHPLRRLHAEPQRDALHAQKGTGGRCARDKLRDGRLLSAGRHPPHPGPLPRGPDGL